MSAVSNNNSLANLLASNSATTARRKNALDSEAFLQLLTTQIRYQNPLDPLKDTEFIGQLSQFSTLEGIQKLNSNFTDMMLLQGLTQGSNLIGKRITYNVVGASAPGRGTVESVQVNDGRIQLRVGGRTIDLSQVATIESR